MKTEPRHPIGVVSARTGIPQDLLRAWEKRYDAVVPGRGATGRRLYTDADIDKLRLLKRAVATGRRISDVAALSLEELKALTQEDRVETVPLAPARIDTSPDGHLQAALNALEHLDRGRVEQVLTEAAVTLSGPQLRNGVIVPLMHLIGERWREGSLRIVHEHFATSIVRSFLAGMSAGAEKAATAPTVLVTTPSGQHHELGALLAAGAADDFGWNAVYLGPNLPAEEIAAAVRHFHPRVLALSVIYRNGDTLAQKEFRKLAQYLDDDVVVIVGGRAMPALQPLLDELGMRTADNLSDFQDLLSQLGR